VNYSALLFSLAPNHNLCRGPFCYGGSLFVR